MKVESFKLNHTKVKAPYIRKCCVLEGKKGDKIPAATEVECGNYRDLSLFGAKEYAREVLKKGFSLNIYGE